MCMLYAIQLLIRIIAVWCAWCDSNWSVLHCSFHVMIEGCITVSLAGMYVKGVVCLFYLGNPRICNLQSTMRSTTPMRALSCACVHCSDPLHAVHIQPLNTMTHPIKSPTHPLKFVPYTHRIIRIPYVCIQFRDLS